MGIGRGRLDRRAVVQLDLDARHRLVARQEERHVLHARVLFKCALAEHAVVPGGLDQPRVARTDECVAGLAGIDRHADVRLDGSKRDAEGYFAGIGTKAQPRAGAALGERHDAVVALLGNVLRHALQLSGRIKERHAVQAEGLLTEIIPRHGQNPLFCVLEIHRLHYTVAPGAGQSESAARSRRGAPRSMAIAPSGAVSRMPITAVESTACPQLSPSASGTPPMAACTVALGR